MSQLFADDDDLADDQDDWYAEDEPRRVRRWLAVVGGLAVLVLVALAGAGIWVARQVDPPGAPGEQVAFSIPVGSSTTAIADMLEVEEVVADAEVFRLYLRLAGGGPFQAGDYTLRRHSAMGDVVAVLEEGPEIAFTGRVTVPEGLTLEGVAEAVGEMDQFSSERFLELALTAPVRSKYQPEDVASLEGLLFPETYTVTEREDEADLLARMVETFDATATELGYDDAPGRVGLTPYETIIVASLIEEEAKVPEDRAKISRVIHNRLEQGMRLQIDATVIFARGERREDGRVLYRDLEIDSPYNTYRYDGLPPTPIAVSGRAALEAALNPADGDWLYYVKYEENGAHAFSTTNAEHNRRIAEAKAKGVLPG